MPALNVPQAAFLQLPHKFRAYVGGYGCVHGDTRIHTEHGLMRICDISRPIRVLSWNEKDQQFQLSLSGGSFPKGRANLYRVTTSQGEFVASGHHRSFSSGHTYQPVHKMVAGEKVLTSSQNLDLTSLVESLKSLPLDDPSLYQKLADSMGRYANEARRYGQRFLKDEEPGLSIFQRLVGALGLHLYCDLRAFSHKGGLVGRIQEHIRRGLCNVQSQMSHLVRRTLTLVFYAANLAQALFFGRTFEIHRVAQQFAWKLKRRHKVCESLRGEDCLEFSLACKSPVLDEVYILAVTVEERKEYWDIQVAGTNNYVDEFGFIHHNSGKTWAGSSGMCARFWQSPGVNQAYYAPTYPHIRDIFFPTIEEVAFGLDLRVEIMEANKEVHFYNGSQYRGTAICRSMERPQTIVGYKVGHSLVDELDTLESSKAKQAWGKIIARMRWPDATNGVDVTTTPEGFRETHRLFVSEVAEKPHLASSYGLVQASTRANAKNLPDGYIQSLLDTYPSEHIDAYIDGRFCNLTTGTIYRCYNRTANASTEKITGGEPLFVGMDFNIGKMAATVYVQRPNGWHAVAELKDLFDTPTMAEEIKAKWKSGDFSGRRIIVYPDASGANGSTKNASVSDISILKQNGFEVKVNPSNPLVRDRILAVNKQFESDRLWVNASACPTVASCLEKQAYDSGGMPDKKGGFDHQNDATGYPIAYEFPIQHRKAVVSSLRM